MTPAEFQKKWEIGLQLNAALCKVLKYKVVPWHTDSNWLTRIDSALTTVPRHMISLAQINAMLVVENLKVDGRPAEASASDYDPKREDNWAQRKHSERISWIAIDRGMMDSGACEEFLRIPFLDARVHEEVAHAWDFALQDLMSLRCSDITIPKSVWRTVAIKPDGNLAPFGIPNRKGLMDGYAAEELVAEDWASAVLWYIFRKEELLHTWSRVHLDFVEDLFRNQGVP